MDFVTHDSSQQHIRRAFYGDAATELRARDDASFQHRSLRALLAQTLLIPLYSLAYIASRLAGRVCRRCGRCRAAAVGACRPGDGRENQEVTVGAEEEGGHVNNYAVKRERWRDEEKGEEMDGGR